MSHPLLASARFHEALLAFDEQVAAHAKRRGCGVCGGRLHVADYERKPRGAPSEVSDAWSRRLSFCCSIDGCRKRMTPPSVRFLGRRVHTGVMVVLAAVLSHGLTGTRLRKLRESLEVDRRTLERWRRWWVDAFPRTDLWTELSGRLDRPSSIRELPHSLFLSMRGADEEERLHRFLRLLAPISHSARMRARFARAA